MASSKKLSIICPNASQVTSVVEFLLARDSTALISIQRVGGTGSLVVRYQGTYSCGSGSDITAKKLLVHFGETGYTENFLVVSTGSACEIKRIWVNNDTVLSAADIERLAVQICANYKGQANGEDAFLVDGGSVNPQPIRVGSNGNIL